MIDISGCSDSPDFVSVIVVYKPSLVVYKNIRQIAAGVSKLLLYNNGGLDRAYLEGLPVEILGEGTNKGVAAALNCACDWGRQHGYKWIATLDQDSTPGPDMWKNLFAVALARFPIESLALIAPEFSTTVKTSSMSFRSGFERNDFRNDRYCGRVWITMTSGNLVNLAAHEAIGGFNESFFIDQVDHDFCLRLNAKNFVVCEISSATLIHSVGVVSDIRRFGRQWSVTRHSPERVRYQTRNLSYLVKLHFRTSPRTVSKLVNEFIVRCIRMVLLLPPDEQISLLSNIAAGFHDAVKRRSGALPTSGTRL